MAVPPGKAFLPPPAFPPMLFPLEERLTLPQGAQFVERLEAKLPGGIGVLKVTAVFARRRAKDV